MGWSPLLKLLFVFRGPAPSNILCFNLVYKVICMVVETCLLFHYNIYIYIYIYIYIEIKYHICIFKNMGLVAPRPHPSMSMAAPRAPLLKLLRITTTWSIFLVSFFTSETYLFIIQGALEWLVLRLPEILE